MQNIREMWSQLNRKTKTTYISAFVAGFLVCFLLSAWIVGKILSIGLSKNSIYTGIHDYFLITLFVAIALFSLIIALLFKDSYRNHVFYTDENGVHIMEKGTNGSARYMTTAEKEKVYNVTNIANTTDHVFAQESTGGERVLAYKKPTKGGTGNQNVLVIATAGTGKSFTLVRVNLIQTILRGDSFVCSDPSGELYRSIAGFCKSRGVDVHVLNLKDPRYSEFWNCLEETIDPETERLDSTRLGDFVSIFMENSGDQKKDFWYTSALNLVKAVIGYVAYKREEEIAKGFISLYKRIKDIPDGKEDAVCREMAETMMPFGDCREIILKEAKEKGLDLEETKKILHDIQYVMPKIKYTIKEVFETILHFADIEEDMKNIPQWHPAKVAYLMYQTSDSENVRQSALQGAQLRFQLFTDKKVQEILSHDGMHISDINKKQSAYFICMSDTTNTLKPITSLFFSFMFKDLQENWDKAQNMVGEGNKNPCRETTIMLDEFYSIGVIGGDPGVFGTYMSNGRKRELHVYIIVQGYSQLEALYGPEIKNVIQGQCGILIYLGGNDPDTVEFISDFAMGDATVLSERHNETANTIANRFSKTSMVTTVQRALMTKDEARRFKEVLIVKQGEYPAKSKPFPWIEHPVYLNGECPSLNIYEEIKPVEQRVKEINDVIPEDSETHNHNVMIGKVDALLKGIKYDENTGEIKEEIGVENLTSQQSGSSKIDEIFGVAEEKIENEPIKEEVKKNNEYKNLKDDSGTLDPSKMTRGSNKKSKNKRSALRD